MDDLRDVLADTAADPRLRLEAATQLARLGPEFHPEIVEQLGEIAHRRRDPDLRYDAWRLLRRLDGPAGERAAAELLHLLGPDEAATWVAWRDFPMPQVTDTEDNEALARAVIRVLRDPARRGDARRSAATTLVTLGRPYHRDALDGVIALLRSRTVPDAELPWLARSLTGLGHAPRGEAAEAFRELLRGRAVTAGIVCGVAGALDHLGHRGDPEVVAALERIAVDETADGDSRGEAAVALARAAPDRTGAAAAVVLSSRRGSDYRWETRLRALAALGTDLVPGLRDVTAASATKRLRREIAAALLAELDPGRREAAIGFVRRVLEDERQSITDRCEAAKNLAQLDDSLAGRSLTVLRRLAGDQERAAHEHELAAYWWDGLSQDRTDGLRQANLLRARDPAATVWFQARLAQRYRGREARETRLALLDDPAVAPGDRFAGLTTWDDPTSSRRRSRRWRTSSSRRRLCPRTAPRPRSRSPASHPGTCHEPWASSRGSPRSGSDASRGTSSRNWTRTGGAAGSPRRTPCSPTSPGHGVTMPRPPKCWWTWSPPRRWPATCAASWMTRWWATSTGSRSASSCATWTASARCAGSATTTGRRRRPGGPRRTGWPGSRSPTARPGCGPCTPSPRIARAGPRCGGAPDAT
ncbi:hypothetical protein [Amycolatopsis methanolica]|uniref:hypothetical protein n=1 Tax=Amycolatopsis methanolica TaxID=1814 RepID=UPI003432F7D5